MHDHDREMERNTITGFLTVLYRLDRLISDDIPSVNGQTTVVVMGTTVVCAVDSVVTLDTVLPTPKSRKQKSLLIHVMLYFKVLTC